MRLSISNIAWDVAEDESIAELLARFSVDAIDIAPGKYFPMPAATTAEDMALVKAWWATRGIQITGMQSLLFGTNGLNLFGSQESQASMLDHLAAICRIGSGIGATRLVFGSPKNRDRTGLTDQQAHDIAVAFFQRLGNIAEDNRVTICLEPNPPRYGSNFMTSSLETLKVVDAVAHSAIKMQLDSGAIACNGEDALAIVRACAPVIGHVHASEPDLVPFGDGGYDHQNVAEALQQLLPNHIVTIEMVATTKEPHHVSIERALRSATKHYRNPPPGAIG